MQRPLILLVEDNPGDVGLWSEALTMAGVADECIVVAADGQQALTSLDAHAQRGALPRLIISDSRLPGMDGTTLGMHIRQQHAIAHVPFIIVSGYVPPSDQRQGLIWYEKPHDFDGLCQLAHELRSHFLVDTTAGAGPSPSTPAP